MDVATNAHHCGFCDRACGADERCKAGQCVPNPRCGNGVVEEGEDCEGGDCCDPDACRFGSAATVCRPAAGPCDLAESCTGTSAICPTDVKAPAGTPCRDAAGACDVSEACDGSSALCPQDRFAAAGTLCRSAAASCDETESCTGATPACPADGFKAAGTVCRPSTGPCDPQETCTGATGACPADVIHQRGYSLVYAWGADGVFGGTPPLAVIAADVDGDGRDDLVGLWDNSGTVRGEVARSDGTKLTHTWAGNFGSTAAVRAHLAGDVDGDGRTDIIQLWDNAGSLGITVYRSNGSGYAQSWSHSNMGQGSVALAFLPVAANADGRTDILQVFDNAGKTGLLLYTSNGTGYANTWGTGDAGSGSGALGWLALDAGGDGRTDLVQVWDSGGKTGLILFYSNGSSYGSQWGQNDMGSGVGAGYFAVDVNGDGRGDILEVWNNNGRTALVLFTSTGAGFVNSWHGDDLGTAFPGIGYAPFDVNGDGLTDLVQGWDNAGNFAGAVFRSTGTGYEWAWSTTNAGVPSAATYWQTGDYDGNGTTDLFQLYDSGGQTGVRIYRAGDCSP